MVDTYAPGQQIAGRVRLGLPAGSIDGQRVRAQQVGWFVTGPAGAADYPPVADVYVTTSGYQYEAVRAFDVPGRYNAVPAVLFNDQWIEGPPKTFDIQAPYVPPPPPPPLRSRASYIFGADRFVGGGDYRLVKASDHMNGLYYGFFNSAPLPLGQLDGYEIVEYPISPAQLAAMAPWAYRVPTRSGAEYWLDTGQGQIHAAWTWAVVASASSRSAADVWGSTH